MDCKLVSEHIIGWLNTRLNESKLNGFVIGVSGGVDSGLVSTLCAKTGRPTICISMPIKQAEDQLNRANDHMRWLAGKYDNVLIKTVDLTHTFDTFTNDVEGQSELSLSNSRSRLRMMTLYACANTNNFMVAGTGNKIEDFGISFFSKFGDGGVDISPIGDLYKSEVRELCKYLGVNEEITMAIPTDGLWGDNRSDEQQIGATYDELEWAMKNQEKLYEDMTEREKEVMTIYTTRHNNGLHKMAMPPICNIPLGYK